jgi:hypothetical protein
MRDIPGLERFRPLRTTSNHQRVELMKLFTSMGLSGTSATGYKLLVHCGWIFVAFTFSCSYLATSMLAANSVFDVLYFGQGVANVAAGSDDPNSTTLVDGDTFQWSITAQNGGYWEVVTGGDFFPLMALATRPKNLTVGTHSHRRNMPPPRLRPAKRC